MLALTRDARGADFGRLVAFVDPDGNPRQVWIAFAAPLLHLVGAESGGFHQRGASTDASSSGKTTIQRAAASICGPPDYLQRWRATDNSLEALAELHNDAALLLDELKQIDPKAAGEVAYMLANGSGKARANRNGDGRPVKRWRLLFLSSGEIGLADHMATANKRARAGQEVRMAEIPADAGAGFGCFEHLHDEPDGAAFALRLSDAAATYHGAPFAAYIEQLIEHRAELPRIIREDRDLFVSDALSGIREPSGQVRRVAARFGLVAVGGELATAGNLTGWPEGHAHEAALTCFQAWLDARGGAIPAEERELIAQVRHWFEQHSNRLRWKNRALDDHAPEVPRQAGFKDDPADAAGGLLFYVYRETFRREVVEGHNPTDAARLLVRRGILEPDSEGKTTQKIRLPGFSNPQRVYVFRSDLGEDADDGP
ncbi:MAG: DUF927 domain-containing protein [Gammaproteobacteria bacterium]|nr:DUF927 domain-containing protein [Gammaproteobacteria bacterium]